MPERAIGGSFAPTELKKFGFFANWQPKDQNNLCTPGSDISKSKVQAFHRFMENNEKILICTHATLRYACEELSESKFNDTLIAIDKFHHVSADALNNRLGELLRDIMRKSTAHIVAMTGSYFRGDSIPVLLPEDEEKFQKVTYNYYEQLKAYDIHELLPEIDVNQVNEPQSKYNKSKDIHSLDDILADDSLGVLGDDDAGLFDFKHTPKDYERSRLYLCFKIKKHR